MKKYKHDTIIDSKVGRREDYLTILIFLILTQAALHCAMHFAQSAFVLALKGTTIMIGGLQ